MEIEEALRIITDKAVPVTENMTVPLCDASGYILAEDIVASSPVPAFARSAMDGYAVRALDVASAAPGSPVKLHVLCEIHAGDSADVTYNPGSCVRVMTGGMIPDGYDAVIKQEDTDYGENEVQIFSSVKAYMNYCSVGEEIQQGDTVLTAGSRIGRVDIGLIASLGYDKVLVRCPARVAVISTGSELVRLGEELSKGKIYGNIRYMLESCVAEDKLEIPYSTDCVDDAGLISAEIVKASALSDVVITTGGVSVGKKDLLLSVLDNIGATRLFSGVDIQPGTPTIASVYKDKIILSLSGNPYAALANFDLYFPPLVSKLMSSDSFLPEVRDAVLAEPYDKVNRMRRFVRAYEKDGEVYLPTESHKSSVFGNMNKCNCYIDVPAGSKLSVGDAVTIRKIRYR